jgi:hypothetical protein
MDASLLVDQRHENAMGPAVTALGEPVPMSGTVAFLKKDEPCAS